MRNLFYTQVKRQNKPSRQIEWFKHGAFRGRTIRRGTTRPE